MNLINLMSLNRQETEELISAMGEPRFRGKQIYKWVHQKAVSHFEEMSDVPIKLRERLESECTLGNLSVITKQTSNDGTVKYLFELPDGNAVESVFLPQDYGVSVCVSSQVGCRMGCRFCASTIGGLVRNLSAGEIYAQVLGIEKEQGRRVSSVVIMGSGEPLDNFAEVVKFIGLITSEDGLNIGARHITVSTCGEVPGIRSLAEERMQITLSVSLHAPNNEIRDQIMPVNKRYPIKTLMKACEDYISLTNRRITFEYALISNFNDSQELAIELGRLLKGLLCHVNLIPLNQVNERDFRQSNPGRVQAFRNALEKVGIPATVRREKGADIDAACGQLRRRVTQEK